MLLILGIIALATVQISVLHIMKMEDSKNTIIVTGIGKDINKEDFFNHFKRIGNIIKSNMRTETPEGIVTYADPKTAEEAAKTLNDSNLKGSVINVITADRFYNHHPGRRDHVGENEVNTAWQLWSRDNDRNVEQPGGAGKGGKGGRGGPNVPSGHDGEDGEAGPGGKGGAGGRPAVASHSENGWQCDRHSGQGGRGGKGGKGGRGGPNVPSGHDGEDGETGPGGKGGAGGRPAVASHGENGRQFDRSNEQGGGGGKGGKGGRGGPNVPSGHDGQDGEPGPGGKGGAGGKPAVTNTGFGNWNLDGNNDPWYTRLYTRFFGGKGGENDKRPPVDNEHMCTGGGKGGQGGQGSFGVKRGHAGEDGEAGPFGKGGRGGKPAL